MQVGAGKSSLLAALLGELTPLSGSARVPGTATSSSSAAFPTAPAGAAAGVDVAYAPQSPWLFSGTIRDNITMGRCPVDEARYLQVRQRSPFP